MVVISVSPLVKLQTPFIHVIHRVIHSPGCPAGPGETPDPNSLCFCHFIIDDVQPGQQDQDFGDAGI